MKGCMASERFHATLAQVLRCGADGLSAQPSVLSVIRWVRRDAFAIAWLDRIMPLNVIQQPDQRTDAPRASDEAPGQAVGQHARPAFAPQRYN